LFNSKLNGRKLGFNTPLKRAVVGKKIIAKYSENILNTMKKFRLKISVCYREIVKNRKDFTQLFTQSQNPCTVVGNHSSDLDNIESYTDFDIKLDGFIWIFVWTFD